MRHLRIVFIIWLLHLESAFSQIRAFSQILYDQRTATVARRAVVIDPSRLTESFARAQAQVYLRENQKNRFVQLVILGDKNDIRMLGMGQTMKGRPMAFEFWQTEYRALMSRRPKAAEVIRIGDNSVIRFTDGEEPKIVAIAGRNPLEISPPWAAGPIKIVLVRFSEEYPWQFHQETDIKDLTVFCEVGFRIDEEMALRLVSYLESLWGLGRVEVVLRRDDLFAAEPYFPYRHLFASRNRWLRLPMLEAYDASPSLICGRQRSGTMGCIMRTFGGSLGYVER